MAYGGKNGEVWGILCVPSFKYQPSYTVRTCCCVRPSIPLNHNPAASQGLHPVDHQLLRAVSSDAHQARTCTWRLGGYRIANFRFGPSSFAYGGWANRTATWPPHVWKCTSPNLLMWTDFIHMYTDIYICVYVYSLYIDLYRIRCVYICMHICVIRECMYGLPVYSCIHMRVYMHMSIL